MFEVIYTRGETVVATVYGGATVLRRVWRDAGRGVLLCSERAYLDALASGVEPRWVGFPKADVTRDLEGVDGAE